MKAKIEGYSIEGTAVVARLRFKDLQERNNFLLGALAADDELVLGLPEEASTDAPQQAAAVAAKPKKAPAAKPQPEAKAPAEVQAEQPQPAAKPATAQAPEADEPANVQQVPAAVKGAASFKVVMEWVVGNKELANASIEEIVALLESWKGQVPALDRQTGDLKERVGRALEVLRTK